MKTQHINFTHISYILITYIVHTLHIYGTFFTHASQIKIRHPRFTTKYGELV